MALIGPVKGEVRGRQTVLETVFLATFILVKGVGGCVMRYEKDSKLMDGGISDGCLVISLRGFARSSVSVAVRGLVLDFIKKLGNNRGNFFPLGFEGELITVIVRTNGIRRTASSLACESSLTRS